jgi:hypothetical protein
MKKLIVLGLLVACCSTPALAIGRYNAMSYSCAGARELIAEKRAVIFRYPAERTRNMTLYDRYVLDNRSCDYGYYAYQSYMPTKDNANCPVYTCRPATDFDDDDIIP